LYQALKNEGLVRAETSAITVNYTSLWEAHYRLLGETPPPGAKPIAGGNVQKWIDRLSPREGELVERRMKVTLREKSKPVKKVIISFYMDNIPKEILMAQRDVVLKFAPTNCEFMQIKTEFSHADALDKFMTGRSAEVILFLDIDCIPLNLSDIPHLFSRAERGLVAGCVQRANHIENNKHLYVGPFCMAITKKTWEEIGRPSFQTTMRGDTGEEITYACEVYGRPVELLHPSHVETPVWDLVEQRFGFGTTYSSAFYHAFGIRHKENQQRFLDKCREVMKP
jgi:hypothetical protein